MKNPLAKDVIALTGDFGKTSTHEAIKRWIQHHGGKFATEINQETTHLICTVEHWKRKVVAVKQAIRHKGVKIVTYDWLEDCLHQKTHKRETPYLLETVVKDNRKKKHERKEKEWKATKKDVREFEKGAKAAEAALGSGGSSADSTPTSPVSPPGSKTTSWAVDALSQVRKECKEREKRVKNADSAIATAKETVPENHHVYRDAAGFDYDITMTRIDWEHNRNERYQLRLFESNTKPHTYATALRYTAPSTPPVLQTLIPMNSPYATAFSAFRHVFRLKTRLYWDERLLSAVELHGLGRSPAVVAAAVARDKVRAPEGVGLENLEGEGGKPFVYRAPTRGKPQGAFPEMWLEKGRGAEEGLEGVLEGVVVI